MLKVRVPMKPRTEQNQLRHTLVLVVLFQEIHPLGQQEQHAVSLKVF